jgi:hypothetical protein
MPRTLTLTLDEDDFATLNAEIALRQARSRLVDPAGPTLMPEGDSCLSGALLAEAVRDLQEYREVWDAEHPR